MSVNFMQVLPGGICFAHGPYEEMTCPKWPACITDPTNAEYYEMGMKKALEDPRDFAIQKLRTELAALSAEVAELRKDAERLDWMQEKSPDVYRHGFREGKWYILPPKASMASGDTLRAAIDAARQEKKDGSAI